jgi:hypothetical protein
MGFVVNGVETRVDPSAPGFKWDSVPGFTDHWGNVDDAPKVEGSTVEWKTESGIGELVQNGTVLAGLRRGIRAAATVVAGRIR